MKKYILISILALFGIRSEAQTTIPKHEVRAVWITTIGGLDWPHSYAKHGSSIEKQQKELCNILDRLKAANVNTVLLQTRVRATVIYPSEYEPWDGCLSGNPGVSPGYDALKFAIDECHRRGMELHAWVVTIPVGKWNSYGCRQLRKWYPSLIKHIGEDGYMDPESDVTADYLANLCGEITRNYDIDGIHLDYIRYPETWKMRVSRERGRKYITDIVRRISAEVKSQKPWVKMSCSPIGKFSDLSRYSSNGWNAYDRVCQDAQGWLRYGYMDQLYPMMYFKGNNFYPFVADWSENNYGKTIVGGLGIYFLSPREGNWTIDEIRRQANVLRQFGAGHAYFRSKFFTDNTKGVYNVIKDESDPYPALIPPMNWISDVKPDPPTALRVTSAEGEGTMLTWTKGMDNSGAGRIYYNVYASRTNPIDINDARNLVAVRIEEPHLTFGTETADGMNFAVTAMDRYGNESSPLLSYINDERKPSVKQGIPRLIRNDGQYLEVPDNSTILDAQYIIIESQFGNIIDSHKYANRIFIGNLPNGIYVIRSLNKKKVTHNLGTFMIKRNDNI